MLSALLLLALVRAPAVPSPGDPSRTLRVGGVDRHFVLHIPRPARRGRLPLVVVLHGAGGNGRRMAAGTGFSAEADRRGFVAVYPDGIDGGWNDARAADGADDVAFVRAMLDTLAGELRTDPDRVYAAGISNGAMFTHRLACELPGTFAAIAAVAGGIPASATARCTGGPPVSFIAFNGTADRLVPFDGGGELLSATASAAHWAAVDGCDPSPSSVLRPDRAPADGTRIRRWSWTGCAPGTAVTLYAVGGGGHSWPGAAPMHVPVLGRTTRDMSATRTIAAFFLAHPRIR
jgi:polyhydroxybutyrate depolymerase